MVFFSAGFDAHAEDDMAMLRFVDADYALGHRAAEGGRRPPRRRPHRLDARRRLRALGARPQRRAARARARRRQLTCCRPRAGGGPVCSFS